MTRASSRSLPQGLPLPSGERFDFPSATTIAPPSRGCPLSHHPGNAARLSHRPGNVILQITDRRGADIAGPHIGPGAAAILRLAGRLAALAAGVGRKIEVPVVAAVPVDVELDRPDPRFNHAGPAHARYATSR